MLVLPMCQNLRSCDLTFTTMLKNDEFDKSFPDADISLPKLESLRLRVADRRPLKWLTVPALDHLELIFESRIPLEEITALVQRSACKIKTFKLSSAHYRDIDTGKCTTLLRSLPDLWYFETTIQLNDAILQEIATGSLMPCLTDLSCRFTMTFDMFIDILESRLGWKDPRTHNFTALKRARCEAGESDGSDESDAPSRVITVDENRELEEEIFAEFGTYVKSGWIQED